MFDAIKKFAELVFTFWLAQLWGIAVVLSFFWFIFTVITAMLGL